jgi:hypothetical protein
VENSHGLIRGCLQNAIVQILVVDAQFTAADL